MPSFQVDDLIKLQPAKHPDGKITYTVDLVSIDGTNDATAGDTGYLQSRTISGVTITPNSTLTKTDESNSTTEFSFQVTGGVHNNDYDVVALVTLSTGDIRPIEMCIPVRDPGCN